MIRAGAGAGVPVMPTPARAPFADIGVMRARGSTGGTGIGSGLSGRRAWSWRSPRSLGRRFRYGRPPQRAVPALAAAGDVHPGQPQHHLRSAFGLGRLRLRLGQQLPAPRQPGRPAAIGNEPVMADPAPALSATRAAGSGG